MEYKKRFTIKAFDQKGDRPLELSRPGNMKSHPWSYMELPFDPEYELYNNRMTPASLNNITPDEQYWAVRTGVILRNTGEFPVEISGKDAFKFANYIFTRDVNKIKSGRCSYQFACYHDGGMITDGVLLKIEEDKYWFAQADGDLFSWYKAHSKNMDVEIKDPEVWVSQIQGPLSMKLLENIAEDFSENDWKYFDWKELQILDQKVIISRSGFTNELGWEIYFRPENETEKIGDYILEEGKKLGMILVATPGFRCRRIEAGLLSAGQDFTKKTNPFSVGLGRFINFDKEDFIGKEALMKSDKKCKTWGIRVAKGTAIKGESIKINEKNIGKITSSTWSPYQICGVGIVHLDNNENGPGDIVDVKCTDGKVHKGEICKLPMYDAKGEIVRGLNRNIPKVPNPWPGIKTTN